MENPIRALLVVVFAVLTVGATLMMPWGELKMRHDVDAMPHTFKLFYVDKHVSGILSMLFTGQEQKHLDFLTKKGAEGEHGEYVYGLALALALCSAAIGIMAIGSADESEKTLIPTIKK